MTYAGLTTADKGALLDAKARGAEWVARDEFMGEINGFIGMPRRERADKYWLQPTGTRWSQTIPIDKENLQFVQWENPEPVNIDLALAQIAEMESKQKELLSEKASEKGCLTWNERINQMTVEEKAWYFVYYHEQSNYEENRLGEVIEVATIGYKTSLAPEQYFYDEADAIAATVKILHSPYTEGANQ